jgi:ankyrin repeat protein
MGFTPLYWAAFTGSKNAFDVLLDKVVEPTTIHLAACKGDLTNVKKFIEGSTDVNVKDMFGCTPLHWAVLADTNDVADFLVGRGAEITARDNTGFTPIMVAHGLDMIEFLISKGADVNVKMAGNGRTRLHTACFSGVEEMAEFLIKKGADVNIKDNWGNTPLHLAASKGHVDVVKLLLKNQANIDAKSIGGYTPLRRAQEKNYTEIVELLRKHGAKE